MTATFLSLHTQIEGWLQIHSTHSLTLHTLTHPPSYPTSLIQSSTLIHSHSLSHSLHHSSSHSSSRTAPLPSTSERIRRDLTRPLSLPPSLAHSFSHSPSRTAPLPSTSERIRRDRLDVLLEMQVHTLGNRLQTIANQPAAVQVNKSL